MKTGGVVMLVMFTVILALIMTILVLLVLVVVQIFRLFQRRSRRNQRIEAVTILILLIAAPYVVFKIWDRQFALARVPRPLSVAAIEYRGEYNWGIGPGGNEVGFVAYRLTDRSARWAQSKGHQLGKYLSDDRDARRRPSGPWLQTPVDENSEGAVWHNDDYQRYEDDSERGSPHRPTIGEFTQRFGYSAGIPPKLNGDVNRAIQLPGSFYRYGRAGSVTIIDPAHGRVYFAYAG